MRTPHRPSRRPLGMTIAGTVCCLALTIAAFAQNASATGQPGPGARKTLANRSTRAGEISQCTGSASAPRRWVQMLYIRALVRCAEGAASDYGVTRFEPAATRNTYSRDVIRSQEGSDLWSDLAYQIVLGRDSDIGGRTYWANRVQAGLRFDVVEANLLGSVEFYQAAGATDDSWVHDVYVTMLDREPGPTEISFWVNRLHAARTRGSIALAIVSSHESRALTADIFGYGYVLHRSANPQDLDFWAERLLHIDQLDLTAQFVASDEGVADASDPAF